MIVKTLGELCSNSANCSRTFPKTVLSVTNSLVYEAVARRSAHELSHDYVVDEWRVGLSVVRRRLFVSHMYLSESLV